MGILKKVFGNTKKPEGFWGKLMVDGMNRGHAPLADWGMSFFGDIRPKAILDCGCGGGRNVAELLKRYPQAEVTGLDYSEVSVKKSQEVNADAVQNGRCRIVQGDVSALPFVDASFDLVSARSRRFTFGRVPIEVFPKYFVCCEPAAFSWSSMKRTAKTKPMKSGRLS